MTILKGIIAAPVSYVLNYWFWRCFVMVKLGMELEGTPMDHVIFIFLGFVVLIPAATTILTWIILMCICDYNFREYYLDSPPRSSSKYTFIDLIQDHQHNMRQQSLYLHGHKDQAIREQREYENNQTLKNIEKNTRR